MTLSSDNELIIRTNGLSGEKVKDPKDTSDDIQSVHSRVNQHHYQSRAKKNSTSASSVSTSTRVVHTTGSIIRTIFPILSWVSHYPVKKYFLYGDLWAGIYIALYLIPQCKSLQNPDNN